MRSHDSSPKDSRNNKGKGKHLIELAKVEKAFYASPKTMKEVDKETGVMRESICWYCRKLRGLEKLFRVYKRRCKVTNYPNVWAWTTNPELVPQSNQLEISFLADNG